VATKVHRIVDYRKDSNPVKTAETMPAALLHLEEAPVSALTRLIHVAPTTSVFAGWGPRMDTSPNDIMRGRD